MKYDLQDIVRNLNGRKLVVWGTGRLSVLLSGKVEDYAPIEFYVQSDASFNQRFIEKPVFSPQKIADKSEYYVVILANQICVEIRECLKSMGYEETIDYYDCFKEVAPFMPCDVNYKGVSVGKGSSIFFPVNLFNYIHSIGRFSAINDSIKIHVNHHMNMIGTGHFPYFLNDENKERAFALANESSANSKSTCKLTIGNDVWIGANVFINASKCSSIGDGAIIGTNALVLGDIPPYAVVYGSPAKVQRYRYTSDKIEILSRVKWWDWDEDTMNRNAELLMYPEKFFEHFR